MNSRIQLFSTVESGNGNTEGFLIFQRKSKDYFFIGHNSYSQSDHLKEPKKKPGHNSRSNFFKNPVKTFQTIPKDSEVVKIHCGYAHVIVQLKDYRIFSVGCNNEGQCSIGNFTTYSTFKRIKFANNEEIGMKVFVSVLHNLFLKKDGTVMGSGYNTSGQLGVMGNTKNQPLPIKMKLNQKVKSISSGHDFTMCLTYVNDVYCCGYCGDQSFLTPTKLHFPIKLFVEKIYTGWYHAIFIADIGSNEKRVFGMGRNDHSQMTKSMLNCDNRIGSPVLIPALTKLYPRMCDIKSGEYYMTVLLKNGTLLGIGDKKHFMNEIVTEDYFNKNDRIYEIIKDVEHVECVRGAVFIITKSGKVYTAGDNLGQTSKPTSGGKLELCECNCGIKPSELMRVEEGTGMFNKKLYSFITKEHYLDILITNTTL